MCVCVLDHHFLLACQAHLTEAAVPTTLNIHARAITTSWLASLYVRHILFVLFVPVYLVCSALSSVCIHVLISFYTAHTWGVPEAFPKVTPALVSRQHRCTPCLASAALRREWNPLRNCVSSQLNAFVSRRALMSGFHGWEASHALRLGTLLNRTCIDAGEQQDDILD